MQKPGIVIAIDGLGCLMLLTGAIGIFTGFSEQSWTIGGIGAGVICSGVFALGFAAAINKLYEVEFRLRPENERAIAKPVGTYDLRSHQDRSESER